MLPIIVKASGFILVILLAYVLKQKGILTSEHECYSLDSHGVRHSW